MRFLKVLLAASIGVVLLGMKPTAEIGHLHETVTADLSSAAGSAITMRVHAKIDEWQSSGLEVLEGGSYIVRAEGKWRAGSMCNVTKADGLGAYTKLCPKWRLGKNVVLPLYTVSALVAKIGEEGPAFGVGQSLDFTANRAGLLFFRINDVPAKTKDNAGFVSVTVKANEPPAPAPVAAVDRGVRVPEAAAEVGEPNAVGVRGQRWAVVIGISEYEDSRIPTLRYARTDAEAFQRWLVSPTGGAYPPSHVKFLADAEATSQGIREALFSWLRQTIEEDSVTIYYAGHGSADSPGTPENLYLLSHDARYDAIASTGFPMWDIETALKRFIKAKRVVVIADACHSGGIGADFDLGRRSASTEEQNEISAGFQKLANVGDGVAVISASDASQFSYEGEEFGGGHGAFTFFLLKGLDGEADYNDDQQVTLGELIPFLSEQVRRATKNTQTPVISGRFDPAMSIGK